MRTHLQTYINFPLQCVHIFRPTSIFLSSMYTSSNLHHFSSPVCIHIQTYIKFPLKCVNIFGPTLITSQMRTHIRTYISFPLKCVHIFRPTSVVFFLKCVHIFRPTSIFLSNVCTYSDLRQFSSESCTHNRGREAVSSFPPPHPPPPSPRPAKEATSHTVSIATLFAYPPSARIRRPLGHLARSHEACGDS